MATLTIPSSNRQTIIFHCKLKGRHFSSSWCAYVTRRIINTALLLVWDEYRLISQGNGISSSGPVGLTNRSRSNEGWPWPGRQHVRVEERTVSGDTRELKLGRLTHGRRSRGPHAGESPPTGATERGHEPESHPRLPTPFIKHRASARARWTGTCPS